MVYFIGMDMVEYALWYGGTSMYCNPNHNSKIHENHFDFCQI